MIHGISHNAISTTDIECLAAFYIDLLEAPADSALPVSAAA